MVPNSDSEKKLRGKISDYLKRHGHKNPTELVRRLNSLVRGWINYYEIRGVTNTSLSKRKLRYYLSQKLFRYYRRKSQRKCRHYGPNAFETLVRYYGLIDPTQYHP
ncbi:group II intron maturase-specific domain-containing protein [Halosquirtibacter laminarini]|uniref:group II intron maturase-specific domain-containing protein n=1 Tax=Halosquirtibacter laminarini TaxID=3374600 RepID=UPI00374979F1